MTELFEITGKKKKFITTRDAARQVSYTPDYVTKLARDGKIISQKIGRAWYVDLDSLKLFVLEREVEKRRHQSEVRDSRRREEIFNQFRKNKTNPELVVSKNSSKVFLEAVAIYFAFVLLVLVAHPLLQKQVTAGDLSLGLTKLSDNLQQAFLLEAWSAWRENLWLVREEERRVVDWVTKLPTETKKLAEDLPRVERRLVPQVDEDSGEVFVIQDGGVVYEEEVKDFFSDHVVTDFYDSRRGTITPSFDNADITAYRFRVVDEPISNAVNN